MAVTRTGYKTVEHLFGAYLHQDWTIDGHSLEEVFANVEARPVDGFDRQAGFRSASPVSRRTGQEKGVSEESRYGRARVSR